MINLANDKYNATLSSGYTIGQSTLYLSNVPDNVPTILVAAKGTINETVFQITGKTTNSVTGVTRLRGANVDLDAQTPITCLNNEEFINQYATALFSAEGLKTVLAGTDGGSTDAYAISISPAPTAYNNILGVPIVFKANTANTGPATLNINSLGAIAIKKNNDVDLVDNDIEIGQMVTVVYDGTYFQMQSLLANVYTAPSNAWIAVAYNANVTLDLSNTANKLKFKIATLTGACDIQLSNITDGKICLVQTTQDGTAGRAVTFPTLSSTFATTDVNTGTDVITVNRNIPTGTPIKFSSTGAVPTGLVAGTVYYAINASATTIKVASSLANAQAGTQIDITATGSGTHSVITQTMQSGGGMFAPTMSGKYRNDLFALVVIDATNGIYMGQVVNADY